MLYLCRRIACEAANVRLDTQRKKQVENDKNSEGENNDDNHSWC